MRARYVMGSLAVKEMPRGPDPRFTLWKRVDTMRP